MIFLGLLLQWCRTFFFVHVIYPSPPTHKLSSFKEVLEFHAILVVELWLSRILGSGSSRRCYDRTTTHTLDLDEHKEKDREKLQGELWLKGFCIDDFRYVQQGRVQRIESTFSKLYRTQIYIWYSLLYIALPDLAIYYI